MVLGVVAALLMWLGQLEPIAAGHQAQVDAAHQHPVARLDARYIDVLT